jgi:TatA/E family protein of Tat protein translocase
VTSLGLFTSTWQLVLVLLILLLLFGSKLPRIARSLGEGITEFKKGLNKGVEGDTPEEEAAERRRLAESEERRRAEAKRTGVDDTTV